MPSEGAELAAAVQGLERTQQELRRLLERFAVVCDALPTLVVYLDRDLRCELVNEVHQRWLGRSGATLLGRTVRDIVGPEVYALGEPYLRRALAGETVTHEPVLPRRIFGRRSVRVTYVPDRVVDGAARGLVILIDDITASRQAEEALRQSERMLAQAQRMAHVGSWESQLEDVDDLGNNPLRWSDETYRIFGYEPGAVPISSGFFYERVHPDDREAVAAAVHHALEHDVPYEMDHRVIRPDGSERVVHEWAITIRDRAGKPKLLSGTVQDLTEQRRAEEEVRQARWQLQTVIDVMPASVARCSADQRVVWVNRSYAEWAGVPASALAGQPLVEVLGPAVMHELAPFVARVLAGEEVEFEREVPYRVGRRWIHGRYAPVRDEHGALDGWVAVVTDITQRKELEHDRERVLAELEASGRRKDEFLAMLAHELRNPLAPVLNAVELLRLRGHGDPLLGQQCEVIARQVQHMRRLLDDLLDVARVSQGKIHLRKERLRLGAVLNQAIEVSRPLIAAKQHRLTTVFSPEELVVEGDVTRLTQIFANLLNNAAKYTDVGGEIVLEAERSGEDAVVRVRDNGIGMSQDLLAHAFELFTQASRSLDRAQGGLGIGLTTARSLALMHGGQIEAHSAGPGLGSELVVRLPLAAEVAATSTATSTPARHLGKSVRVLVVDDNRDAAESLGGLLEIFGHEVLLAYDGPSAVELALREHPAVVFLDIGLPGMDGYEVARRLRQAGLQPLTLVALTGYGRDDDLRRSRESGFDRHIVKPADVRTLESIVAQSA